MNVGKIHFLINLGIKEGETHPKRVEERKGKEREGGKGREEINANKSIG